MDVAGVVDAVGKGITTCRPGDEVFGDVWGAGGGALAQYVCVPAACLAPAPRGLTLEQAAAVPLAGATALQALRRAAPAKGDHVLVQGAAGGVGTFAVQIAKALGARVTAVCSARNADQAGELGADRVVDYAITDVTAEGERYDVILGVNGYHPIRAYRRMLAPGGRYLMVGGGGRQMLEALALGRLLSLGGDRSLGFVTAKTGPEDLAELTRLIGEGSVRPVIDRTFPLAEAAEAMRHLGGGHARGKVVVAVE